MYIISKRFSFSASHQLAHLPNDHPCRRLHGHNYEVLVELAGPTLTDRGFIRDYGELRPLQDFLDKTLDHRHLIGCQPNGLKDPRWLTADSATQLVFGPPMAPDVLPATAENIAGGLYRWCKNRWPEVISVSVAETPKTWAVFKPAQPTSIDRLCDNMLAACLLLGVGASVDAAAGAAR